MDKKSERTEKSRQRSARYRITKVTTRAGDEGMSQLVGGRRVPKNDPRLAAYGAVDEIQVAIGAARDALRAATLAHPGQSPPLLAALEPHLIYLQNLLFTLCADLATRLEDRWAEMPLPTPADLRYMEALIGELNAGLAPLQDFMLPGGHPAATACHVCRVVCRRAERELETLAAAEPIGELSRPILNRLSDLFYVLARRVAHELERAGLASPELIWRRGLPTPPLPKCK